VGGRSEEPHPRSTRSRDRFAAQLPGRLLDREAAPLSVLATEVAKHRHRDDSGQYCRPMADRSDAKAVLVTGAFGVGKTSLIEELAEIFEERGMRYAAIDLDWLCWFDPGSNDHAAAVPTLLKNVDAVAGNYYQTGVRLYVLAGAMDSRSSVEDLRVALGMPMTTVRLTAPLDEIERRLSSSVTSGRQIDLSMARAWYTEESGEDVGDVVVANDGPLRDVAREVLVALGW
jgi:hypothetical protein